jgi:hypothetical protein
MIDAGHGVECGFCLRVLDFQQAIDLFDVECGRSVGPGLQPAAACNRTTDSFGNEACQHTTLRGSDATYGPFCAVK